MPWRCITASTSRITRGSRPPGSSSAPSCTLMSVSSARRSTKPSSPASVRAARARMPGSFVATPSAIPRRPASARASSRPTEPKSSSQIVPSSSSSRLPGCGSAWNSPSSSTWPMNDASSRRASSSRGTGDSAMARGSSIGRATSLLHDQHAAGREARADPRHGDAGVVGAVLAQPRADRALVQVVELLLEPRDQLLAEAAEPDRAGGLDAALELGGGEPQHGGVARDDRVDPRPLHLHHHRRAVGEHSAGRSGRSTPRRAARTRTSRRRA